MMGHKFCLVLLLSLLVSGCFSATTYVRTSPDAIGMVGYEEPVYENLENSENFNPAPFQMDKRAMMRFGKRAMMRFGKRSMMRFG